MVKPIWTVRSIHRLFNGLNVAIAAFSLGYSLLCVLVLPELIPFRFIPWVDPIHASRYFLAILPSVILVVGVMLWVLSKKAKHLRYEINEVTKPTAEKDRKNHMELLIGINFLLMVSGLFFQMDALNTAKQIDGFGVIPAIAPLVLLIPFVIYKLMITRKIYLI